MSNPTFEGPNIQPGDRFIVRDGDGAEHEDTVHSIRYRSAEPEIRHHPTGWRRLLRDLTPRRWRKPLPIVRPYRPADVEVIGKSEVARRAAQIEELRRFAASLPSREPK